MFLADTCIWIDFLRGKDTQNVGVLEELLEEGEAYICEIIFAEILWGSKDKLQYKTYKSRFSAMPFLQLPNYWYEKVAEMGFALRTKGFKPFIADLIIAFLAIHHDVYLLTDDKDFVPYKKLFNLKLIGMH